MNVGRGDAPAGGVVGGGFVVPANGALDEPVRRRMNTSHCGVPSFRFSLCRMKSRRSSFSTKTRQSPPGRGGRPPQSRATGRGKRADACSGKVRR
jgi:hypothetical protein